MEPVHASAGLLHSAAQLCAYWGGLGHFRPDSNDQRPLLPRYQFCVNETTMHATDGQAPASRILRQCVYSKKSNYKRYVSAVLPTNDAMVHLVRYTVRNHISPSTIQGGHGRDSNRGQRLPRHYPDVLPALTTTPRGLCLLALLVH
jgi:hypothetical protein